MKKRILFKSISKYLHHKNALVITGMRQVGKTTLMRQLFDSTKEKAKLWFDLENPLEQKVFEDTDYRNIYEVLVKMIHGEKKERLYIFIDEIQNFPPITKVIKYLIDHYSVKFILTGSSSFYLKNLFPESLSGRKFLYVLHPLFFREFLYFKGKLSQQEIQTKSLNNMMEQKSIIEFKKYEPDYAEYLKYGGFPEVVITENNETKLEILKNIFVSFFEKDLKMLSDYKDIRELRDLILLLVPRVGSMLDVTRLSNELGTQRMKIYNYLEFLQGTFFIRLLPKFSNKIDHSVAGGKKVYFSDTGLLNHLGSVNEPQLFENAVVNQLTNYGNICFYNKRNTAEIDVILDKKYAFEIKTTGSEHDLKKTQNITEKIGIKETYVISKNFREGEHIIFPMFI